MRDVSKRYGELLVNAHQTWLALVKKAGQDKTPVPSALPDANQEELRQVLYAADAPVLVPQGAIVDLEWFFDEAGRVELTKLQAEIDRWIIKSASPPYAVVLEDRPTQRNPRVFIRGNPVNKGEEVPRQFLELLAGEKRKPFTHGSGRLDLANAIASKDNPLTARVMVNRIWLHHFDAGLVRTPSDFGTRCEPPTHPELLDWLACRFMADGWSIKKLHRLIMLSAVYQQSSDVAQASSLHVAKLPTSSSTRQDAAEPANRMHALEMRSGKTLALTPALSPGEKGSIRRPAEFSSFVAADVRRRTARVESTDQPVRLLASAATVDPENRLLWHFNRERLDFESMRDSLLAVSGELDMNAGGKPVELFKKPSALRRTVYGFIDRQFLPGVFRVFDFANPDMHNPQRLDTTVPQQALFFMNSPFVVERARALTSRSEVAALRKPKQRIQDLYRLVFQRPPTARQVELGREFLAEADEKVGSSAIRQALAAGDVERVGRLLGRPFSLRGPVVAGDRRGRTLGFPTANMAIGLDRALPAYGIYVTRAYVRESAYESCTSIGIRPTFDVEPRPVVETFILDFDEEIYGREMQIDLLHRLRGEERFASAEELVAQMEKDVGATREWFDTE